MTRLLYLAVIVSTLSCKIKTSNSKSVIKDIEVVKQLDYRITIDVWNGFSGHQSKFILNNSRIDTYDSTDTHVPLSI